MANNKKQVKAPLAAHQITSNNLSLPLAWYSVKHESGLPPPGTTTPAKLPDPNHSSQGWAIIGNI